MIDSDQHLYETRTMWLDHIDPDRRDDALRIVDDELGYPWLTWGAAWRRPDVQLPGRRRGWASAVSASAPGSAGDALRRRAAARLLGRVGARRPARGDGCRRGGRVPELRPVVGADARRRPRSAHREHDRVEPLVRDGRDRRAGAGTSGRTLHLGDAAWLDRELADLERDGVHLAMIAPALVDGRPLSHPDHDPIWRAFVEHGVTPVFHVADQRRVFDDVWYTAPDRGLVPPLESIFLWTAAALACTDLILNGTLERLPDLRIGIVELSAVWVPMFLMMLDGGTQFTARLNGRPVYPLAMKPSEYFRRQVRVSSFSYELPGRLIGQTGDLYMCCSDYPHSEGTATPISDYERSARPVVPAPTRPGCSATTCRCFSTS